MTLGINGIRLVTQRSGVARCIEAFLNCLADLDHPFGEIRVYTPRPIEGSIRLPGFVRHIIAPSKLALGLWEQVTLPKVHGAKDLLLCPSYVVPLGARCPTFLIHHGSYEGYPQAFDWWTLNKARLAYSLSARCATGLSTVSEYSRRDMVRYYGIAPEKINVVPEGVDIGNFRPISDAERLSEWRISIFGADEPFIAYVGKPTERRNLSALIRAYGALKRKDRIPHKFVIAGASLPGTSPFRKVIEEEGLTRDVFVRGYVGHKEMPVLYNAADLLVYPSSYEGFGMPVLEAMACGTPVIALDNTAFPEFAGGVALLLPNASPETLRSGILRVLSDGRLRKRMSLKGPVRAAAYDWKVVTRRYLDLMIPLVKEAKGA